jgi:class 3 adenylate cyclase
LLIHLHNTSDDFQSIKIERRQWYEYAVKAFMLTSFQEFTDLFHSQVLRPGLELGVSQIVLMFTDLKDSTQLYDEQGDAKAFSLVHDHYEIMKAVLRKNRGTIVKTIGDAIMASFQNPEDALVTAVGFLESFAKWNKEHAEKEQIILKIGFHMGPSLLLNQNGMLDYFGQTVNTAARIQGQSKGNDIVISREIYQHTRIQKKIKQLESSGQTFKMEKFSADLKGISQTTELIRLVL